MSSDSDKLISYCQFFSSSHLLSLSEYFLTEDYADEKTQVCLLYIDDYSKSSTSSIQAIKDEFPFLPVLAVIKSVTDEDTVTVLNAGASDCVCASSSVALIAARARKLVESAKVAQELNIKKEQVEDVLERIHQEENFARHVYEEITGGALNHKKDYFSIQHSASGFCGDFLFEMMSPTGIRYVFLADAMGHGLAAALSILPVIHVVKAMAHRSMPLTTIVHEVNHRLNIELPDDRFVSMAAVEISPFSEMVSIVNAGLPDVFVAMRNGKIQSCASQCIPLGVMEGAAFSFEPYTFQFNELAHLMMYSDGLIEQENEQDECISRDGLCRQLNQFIQDGDSWENMAELFELHKGDMPLSDDVTMCAIDFDRFKIDSPDTEEKEDVRKGKVEFTLRINGDYLKSIDAPAFVSKFLYASDIEGKIAGKTFTAIAELYQNGLDHGVLGLDSTLKNDIEGFGDYLEQRESRLADLGLDDNVTLTLSYKADEGITANVKDSGQGYDIKQVNPDQFSLYGRGLALVRQLSESFQTNDTGNEVTITLKET